MLMDLHPTDLRRVLHSLKYHCKPVHERILATPGRLFLAGGYIRSVVANEPPSDIDLFAPTLEEIESHVLHLQATGWTKVTRSQNAITLKKPGGAPVVVQFITRWLYTEVGQLLSEFDFTIAKAVIWSAPNEAGKIITCGLVDGAFYADLAAKRLVYCAPVRAEDVGGSLLRVRKFLRKGYWIDAMQLAAVVSRFVMGVRQVQEVCSEPVLTKILCGLMKEVDPNAILPEELVEQADLWGGEEAEA